MTTHILFTSLDCLWWRDCEDRAPLSILPTLQDRGHWDAVSGVREDPADPVRPGGALLQPLHEGPLHLLNSVTLVILFSCCFVGTLQ